MRVDLEDPNTHPNPEIQALLDVSGMLFGLTLNGDSISALYADADRLVKAALVRLFEIKNAIASAQGER